MRDCVHDFMNCMNERLTARMNGWTRACMHGWTDGRTDGRMDGWMDGWLKSAWEEAQQIILPWP